MYRTKISKDSGFESRVGFTMTHWPNGKAFDYEVYFLFFARISFADRDNETAA